jgi:hypothetical protein
MMLDNFVSGNYVVTLLGSEIQDVHSEPIDGRMGPTRRTIFQIDTNAYNQPSRLDIGNGICIQGSGFDANPSLNIYYGSQATAPLGLDLSAYTRFKLSFAGLVAGAEDLLLSIAVWPHDLDQTIGFQQLLSSSVNAFTWEFPFSVPPENRLSDYSNIDQIVLSLAGGGDVSFGLTRFEALE